MKLKLSFPRNWVVASKQVLYNTTLPANELTAVRVDHGQLLPGDVWEHLAIHEEDITVLPENNNMQASEVILYETDPHRSNAYSVLRAQDHSARRSALRLGKRMGRAAFRRLVRLYRVRKLVKKWTGKWLVNTRLPKISNRGQWTDMDMTKLQYLFYLLLCERLTPVRRQRTLEAIKYIQDNPEKDVERYRLSVRVPAGVKAFCSNTSSLLNHRVVPAMRWKWITTHEWKRVKVRWSALRRQLWRRIDVLTSLRDSLQRRMAAYSYMTNPSSNWMVNVCTGARLSISKAFIAAKSLLPEEASWIYPGWAVVDHDSCYASENELLSPDTPLTDSISQGGWTAEVNTGIYRQGSHTLLPCNEILIAWLPPTGGPPVVLLNKGIPFGAAQEPEVQYNTSIAPTVSFSESPRRLEYEFEAKRLAARAALLNLRPGEDRLVFNATRSVGELKDTPETFKSMGQVVAWFQGQARNVTYYEITTRGRKLLAPVNVPNPGPYATQAALIVAGKIPKDSKPLGILKVTKRIVTRATPWSVVASLYLAYKFGVEPTIQDSIAVRQNGFSWAVRLRRSLSQLVSHLDSSRGIFPIRRMYSTGARVNTKSEIPASSVTELNCTVDWTMENDACLGLNSPRPEHLIIKFDPEYGLGFVWPGHTAEELALHEDQINDLNAVNEEILKRLFPDEGLVLAERLEGCVYANFDAKTLWKALRPGLRNWIAQSAIFTTLWELAPLSFIVDWLTNIGEVVRAAEDLLSAKVAKLNPIGKPWERLRCRIYAKQRIGRNAFALFRMRPKKVRIVKWRLYNPDDPSATRGTYITLHRIVDVVQYSLRVTDARPYRWSLTPLRRTIRRPFEGDEGSLPPIQVRLRISAGKLGSLLAMYLSGRKTRHK